MLKKRVTKIVMINMPLFFPDTDRTPKYAKFDFYHFATYITKIKIVLSETKVEIVMCETTFP